MKRLIAVTFMAAAAWAQSTIAIAGRDGSQLLHHAQTVQRVKAAQHAPNAPAQRPLFVFVDSRRSPNFR